MVRNRQSPIQVGRKDCYCRSQTEALPGFKLKQAKKKDKQRFVGEQRRQVSSTGVSNHLQTGRQTGSRTKATGHFQNKSITDLTRLSEKEKKTRHQKRKMDV